MSVAKLHGDFDSETGFCIPEGRYKVVFVGESVYAYRSGYKLRVQFRILGGPYCDMILDRHYNVKTKSRGWAAPGWKTDLVREIQQVTGERLKRLDRLSLKALLGRHIILAEIRTVRISAKGETLAPINRYSVVSRMICADT